jgi:branched-chain amino acid transport system substrate-binding protein
LNKLLRWAVAAIAFSFLINGTTLAKEETIIIGLVAPITGDQAFAGLGIMQGAQIAVEEANAKSTVPGVKLKLLALDDQHNPTQAVLAANKLVADPAVLGVVGHFNSSCSKAASAIYHEARLVQVTPTSTNPEISKQGFDTFFRVCPTDDVQGPSAAEFIFSKLGKRSIVVIDDRTTYGKGLADELERKFRSLGGKVLSRDGITQGEKDFTPLLSKIKSLGPDLIYFGGIYPELSLLIKQSHKLGLRTPWMGGDGIFDVTLIQLATPQMSEGTYATMLGVDPHSLPAAQEFVAKYEARYGPIGSFSAYGYDTTNLVIDAIRRAEKKDREGVLLAVRRTKDFEGILGPINFDEKGDAIGKSVGIFKVENGKFVFIEEAKP